MEKEENENNNRYAQLILEEVEDEEEEILLREHAIFQPIQPLERSNMISINEFGSPSRSNVQED